MKQMQIKKISVKLKCLRVGDIMQSRVNPDVLIAVIKLKVTWLHRHFKKIKYVVLCGDFAGEIHTTGLYTDGDLEEKRVVWRVIEN